MTYASHARRCVMPGWAAVFAAVGLASVASADTLYPTADSFIRGGSSSNSNAGLSDELYVKKHYLANVDSNTRFTYLTLGNNYFFFSQATFQILRRIAVLHTTPEAQPNNVSVGNLRSELLPAPRRGTPADQEHEDDFEFLEGQAYRLLLFLTDRDIDEGEYFFSTNQARNLCDGAEAHFNATGVMTPALQTLIDDIRAAYGVYDRMIRQGFNFEI